MSGYYHHKDVQTNNSQAGLLPLKNPSALSMYINLKKYERRPARAVPPLYRN